MASVDNSLSSKPVKDAANDVQATGATINPEREVEMTTTVSTPSAAASAVTPIAAPPAINTPSPAHVKSEPFSLVNKAGGNLSSFFKVRCQNYTFQVTLNLNCMILSYNHSASLHHLQILRL
jgi:hypothetical protein